MSPESIALVNGRIWTGDASRPWAEALLARGDRLVVVGSDEDVAEESGAGTEILDLRGRLALPGFIDDHTHFVHGGFQLLSVDLRDAATPEEFARRIRSQAESIGPGRWITGGDWDHELWPGAPLPTKDVVDATTPDNPVFVSRFDGHMRLANSVTLGLAGISRETPDPPGGMIVRDAAGEPTGVLKDAAVDLVARHVPQPSVSEYDEALDAAMAEAARVGVTSIQDITPWSHWDVYRRFRDRNRLTLRVYARTPMRTWQRQADLVASDGAGDAWLRLGGLKAFMDGSLGSATALFFDPYADEPATAGLWADDNLPVGKLQEHIVDADDAGLQCSIHAIGDKANSTLLDYFAEAIRRNGTRDRRFRVEHAQHLRRRDIPRFAALGIIASAQPYHAVDDGRWADRRLGDERAKMAYAFRSLLEHGVTVAFGSDWTVAPLAPLLGIHAAVTRATIDGHHPNGWVPEQKIGVEEAVRAYTAAGAYAEFAEHDKGTLAPGRLADVVVLSDDIFAVPPVAIREAEVVLTIAGGRVVYSQ